MVLSYLLLYRCLLTKSRCVNMVFDWQKIHSEFGPPIEHRLDKID